MDSFKDFDIKPDVLNFTGDKIKMDRIVNVEIEVHDYKIGPSTINEGTECLTLQIEKKGEKHIVFTGSKILIQMIKQVPENKFPFKTTITRDNEYYEFN